MKLVDAAVKGEEPEDEQSMNSEEVSKGMEELSVSAGAASSSNSGGAAGKFKKKEKKKKNRKKF